MIFDPIHSKAARTRDSNIPDTGRFQQQSSDLSKYIQFIYHFTASLHGCDVIDCLRTVDDTLILNAKTHSLKETAILHIMTVESHCVGTFLHHLLKFETHLISHEVRNARFNSDFCKASCQIVPSQPAYLPCGFGTLQSFQSEHRKMPLQYCLQCR